MNRSPTPESRRTYKSALRAEQAEATRQRIVSAAEMMARGGDRELSFMAVSREAQVAIATVYRHFPERRDLLLALSQRIEAEERPSAWEGVGLAAIKAAMTARYATQDQPGPRAAHLERVRHLFELSRMTSIPMRRAIFDPILREHAPGLPDAERAQLVDLSAIIASSAVVEAFCGYLGCSAREASEHVGRALDAVLALAIASSPPSSPPESP